MNEYNVAVEPEDISQYSNGLDFQMWVHTQPLTDSYARPANRFFFGYSGAPTTPPAITLGGYYGISILPSAVPHGFRLKSIDGQVVTADASSFPLIDGIRRIPASSGLFPHRPLDPYLLTGLAPSSIPSDGTVNPRMYTSFTYSDYLPFFSVESGEMDSTKSTNTIRNVGAGAHAVEQEKFIQSKLNTKGYTTRSDPMRKMLLDIAGRTDQRVWIRLVMPDHESLEFAALVLGTKRNWKVDDPYMTEFSFAISGEIYRDDLTPS